MQLVVVGNMRQQTKVQLAKFVRPTIFVRTQHRNRNHAQLACSGKQFKVYAILFCMTSNPVLALIKVLPFLQYQK